MKIEVENIDVKKTDEIVSNLHDILINENKVHTKRIIFLCVELLQNIIHHSDVDSNGNNHSKFILEKEDYFTIETVNLIAKTNSDIISKKIDETKKMSEEELKQEIQNKLLNSNLTEKQCAGVGLMTLQRKSKLNLNYNIQKFNDEFNLITLTIKNI